MALCEERVGLALPASLPLPSGMGSEYLAQGNSDGSTTIAYDIEETRATKDVDAQPAWPETKAERIHDTAMQHSFASQDFGDSSGTSTDSIDRLPPGTFLTSPTKSRGSFSSPFCDVDSDEDAVVLPPFPGDLSGEGGVPPFGVPPFQGLDLPEEEEEEEEEEEDSEEEEPNQHHNTPPPQTPKRTPPAHKTLCDLREDSHRVESKRKLDLSFSPSPSKTASAKLSPLKAIIAKAPHKAPLGLKAGKSRGRMQVQKAIDIEQQLKQQHEQHKIVDYFQPVRRWW